MTDSENTEKKNQQTIADLQLKQNRIIARNEAEAKA